MAITSTFYSKAQPGLQCTGFMILFNWIILFTSRPSSWSVQSLQVPPERPKTSRPSLKPCTGKETQSTNAGPRNAGPRRSDGTASPPLRRHTGYTQLSCRREAGERIQGLQGFVGITMIDLSSFNNLHSSLGKGMKMWSPQSLTEQGTHCEIQN